MNFNGLPDIRITRIKKPEGRWQRLSLPPESGLSGISIDLRSDDTLLLQVGDQIVQRLLICCQADISAVSTASNQSNQTSEFCFHNASRLPVVEHTADWSLVEEGYGRISKQGWRTTTVGGLLHLALPRLRTCGAVVTLGFQRTNTSGVFELGCRHCSCVAQRHFFQDPFPIVSTRTRQAMRVTAMTTFTALLTSADHACVLRVNHTEGPTIRIDSLHVHEPTAQEALRSKRSLSNKAQQAFGRHALQTTACDSIVVETS